MATADDKELFLKELGIRVAKLRELAGLSQTELANECEKDRQSINRLEKGKVNASAFYLSQICIALGVSLQELFSIPIDNEE